jgi:ABC-type nitrate/sulfonate/bicarbonate transport system substrate-binding protein
LLAVACAPAATSTASAPPAKPAVGAAPGATVVPAAASAPASRVKVVVGTLTIPTVSATLSSVMKNKDFATNHGLDVEIKDYSAIAAILGAYVTGEVQVGITGPHSIQRMRNDGVPMQIISTMARLDGVRVLTADPRINDLSDLRGKRLAADLASSEYQVALLYAKKSKGIDFRSDVTVVNAGQPLARQQLKTGEVDAAVLWEPVVAQALLEDNPDYRSVFDGQKAWREMTNSDGWELVGVMNEELARQNPDLAQRVNAMMQDVVQFINEHPDEAAVMVERELKLPARVFKEAVASGRLVLIVEPAWEPAPRQAIEEMFKAAVEVGYLDRLPQSQIFYQPQ